MKYTCGLPNDTLIVWRMSDGLKYAYEKIYQYIVITDNLPPKQMIDKLAKEVLEID